MVLQLDGRHMVQILRRKYCYVLMDKSGHWVRWDCNASHWQRQSFWDEFHLAILIRSDVEWMRMSDLRHSYVANPSAIKTIPEMPPAVWRVVMWAFIDSHNAFLRELNDSGEVGAATAKRHSKIPCAGLRQLPPPDELLQLFEYTCPVPYMSAFLGGRLKRSARAVQLFGRLAILETHTLWYFGHHCSLLVGFDALGIWHFWIFTLFRPFLLFCTHFFPISTTSTLFLG